MPLIDVTYGHRVIDADVTDAVGPLVVGVYLSLPVAAWSQTE